MSVTIDLPPDVEANLAARSAAGRTPSPPPRGAGRRPQGCTENARGTGQAVARRVGASRYETALRRGDQPREHLRRARVSILLDTNVPLRRVVQLPAMRAIGCGHNRIEAGWAITSVCPKSAPLNTSGARMTADTA
jgi:hypothetical protein